MNIYIFSLLLEECNAIAVRYIVFIKKKKKKTWNFFLRIFNLYVEEEKILFTDF